MRFNTEKFYLMGLLVGGGIFKSDVLQIVLPYKKWGSLKINPERGGEIAEDILKTIKPLWKSHYDVDISYKIGVDWKITFSEVSDSLKNDIALLGLETVGEFRETANLDKIKTILLSNKEFAKSFIAGIVDTVGSLALSHRRFSSDFQIVSLEFKGQNFKLVSDISEILEFIDCVPDQVLWNHPNQHSGHDRYYKSWKKGFKIRALLDAYILKGSFVFEAKQLSANENQKMQKKTDKIIVDKKYNISGRTCLHVDENSSWLPQNIRGFHFIHFTHLAKFLDQNFSRTGVNESTPFERYISPFTILTKGSISQIKEIIKNEDYLNNSKFYTKKLKLEKLVKIFEKDNDALLFGNTKDDGFPLNYILQGIAFILSIENGGNVRGKRVLGNYLDVIKQMSKEFPEITVKIPDRGTCIFIFGKEYATLVGYINDSFNKTLIVQDGLKIRVKQPTYENCIKLERV